MPDMPTASHDFIVGELITTINGVKTKNITENKRLDLSNQPGEYEVCRIRQSEQQTTMSLSS
jgi:hypothetical protein